MLGGDKDIILSLITRVEELMELVGTLSEENKRLKQEVVELREENKLLRRRVLELEKESEKPERYKLINQEKKVAKARKTTSLRKKNRRKTGGQKNHKGTTLEMVSDPDIIIEHRKEWCDKCGMNLANISGEIIGRRQVMDIPPIKMLVTEHQILARQCECGGINRKDWPEEVRSPVSYGPNIVALVAYLSSRQYIPFKRLKEFMNFLFSVPLSEGTINNMLNKTADSLDKVYEKIRQAVQRSEVVGIDETGYHANGIKGWTWAFQTNQLTFLCCTDNRGSVTIDSYFPEGFKLNTIVSDCWRAIIKQKSKAKQICLAHLLREFIHLREVTDSALPRYFIKLLKRIYALHQTGKPDVSAYRKIKKRLDRLLRYETKQGTDLQKLQNRLNNYREYITTCIENFNVPPDNNGTERALRNVKVKMKVSGQFKSIDGAQVFAVLRSIVDTGIKNSINPIDAIRNPDLISLKLPE